MGRVALTSGTSLNRKVLREPDPVQQRDAVDNSDVFFSRSTNDGATWSAMLQVGAGGGATDQFEPNVAVNDTGDVAVAWYDRRNDVTTTPTSTSSPPSPLTAG